MLVNLQSSMKRNGKKVYQLATSTQKMLFISTNKSKQKSEAKECDF